jgi:hypothetical protein
VVDECWDVTDLPSTLFDPYGDLTVIVVFHVLNRSVNKYSLCTFCIPDTCQG